MLVTSLLIRHLLPELTEALKRTKIIAIRHQPEIKEVILVARGAKRASGLLLNYDPKNYHLRLVADSQIRRLDYPKAENLFFDLLDSQIEDLQQIDFDRIVKIIFSKFDPLWGVKQFHLYAEINANLNLILTDHNDQIIDSLKSTPSDSLSQRIIRPGVKYILPVSPAKADPFQAGDIDWQKIGAEKPSETLRNFLVTHFLGIDPSLAEEIIYQAFLPAEITLSTLSRAQAQRLSLTFRHFFVDTVPLHPALVTDEKDQPRLVAPYDYSHIPPARKIFYPGLNQALTEYYQRQSLTAQFENKKRAVLADLNRRIEKIETDLQKNSVEIKEKSKFEELKKIGDLIMINKQAIKKGTAEIELADLYADPQSTVEVALNPERTALQNAQDYYKKFQKAKSGLALLEKRNQHLADSQGRLKEILSAISRIQSQEELASHQARLAKLGIVKPELKAKARKKPGKKHFRQFNTSDGWTVLVGRNNQENDQLTFKTAQPDDFWLHASGIPGSHVVLRREDKKRQLPHKTLLEAASIAAYFSKGRNSRKVEVIYTLAKHVRKPQKAKPGLALVEKEKSILVTPKLPEQKEPHI